MRIQYGELAHGLGARNRRVRFIHVLLDLFAHCGVRGQTVNRRLRGQSVCGQPDGQRLRVERHQRADERALVAHHHAMLHDRALGDLLLQRDGGDVLAAGGDNNVLDAAGDDDAALVINLGQIAGPEPAVGGERLGRFLGQIMVAAEHVRALDLQLALIGNTNRGAGSGLAHRADHIVGHACGGERGGGFGHAVALDHRQSDAVVEMRQIKRQRRSAASHVLDLRAQSATNRAVDERLVLGALGDLGKRMLLARLLLAAPDARCLGGLQEQATLPAGAGLVRGGVVHLLEHTRHTQQVGRLKGTQIRQQRLGVRQVADHAVVGGDGGVLDESREAVGQRQEEQQSRVIVENHLMQRLRGGDGNGHEVLVGQLRTLRVAGGARGIHDGGQVIGAYGGHVLVQLFVGDSHAEAFQSTQCVAVNHKNLLQRGAVVLDRIEPVIAFAVVGKGQLDRGIVHDALGLRGGVSVVNRHAHRAHCSQREVEDAPFKAGGGEDSDRVTFGDAQSDETLGGRDHTLVEFAGGDVLPTPRADFLGCDYRVGTGAGQSVGEQ